MCILVTKLKNNVQYDILNFFECVLFSLTIDREINNRVNFHIQKSGG